MRTKKITVFYSPSFQELLAKMGDFAIDLMPAMQAVENFFSIVTNLCLFGPEVFLAYTTSALEKKVANEFGGQLVTEDTIDRIKRSSRVEFRVSFHTAGDGFTIHTIKAEALFFELARKKLIVFGIDISANDGAVVGCGLVTSDSL